MTEHNLSHFNPPLKTRQVRDDFIKNNPKYKNWVRIDVTESYVDKLPHQRREKNAEAKKWCVTTTHHDWFIYQQESYSQVHGHTVSGYRMDRLIISTFFCFSNLGEATLFRLTFGGVVV